MSQRALISVLILFCLNAGFLSAQVSTLDPSQTVNPATGEMGFSLPLGTVQGISKGFPVNLSYQAGIKLDQEASPAGLGFNYAPGIITRKQIFVPDDAIGSHGNYYTDNDTETDIPAWRKIINIFLTIIGTILAIAFAIFTYGAGSAVPAGLVASMWTVGGISLAINLIPLSPGDYIAGGEHIESYRGKSGTGFFRGANDDLPDLFFVNTSFVSGQFSWEGDRTNGRFVWKSITASNEKDYETVKINEKTDSKGYLLFEIVLNDGTRLIFDKYNKTPHFEDVWNMTSSGALDICGKAVTQTFECVPECWHLTKILYSDYVDGGGSPDDPLDNYRDLNKGEWVAFEYDSIAKTRIFKAFRMTQLYGTTALHSLIGRINNPHRYPDGNLPLEPITLSWLKKIHTPVDFAVFTYSMDRKDDLWFDAENNDEIVPMPVLKTISFKNKDGSEKSTYTFNTDYDLRPNSFNSFKKSWQLRGTNNRMLWPDQVERLIGNIGAKSLTLRSISVSSAGKMLPPVIFSYDEKTNFEAYSIAADDGKIDYTRFYMDDGCDQDMFPERGLYERHWYTEQKDYWGYFRRNTTGSNRFNPYGSRDQACISGTDIPYASAWSLKSVRMPTGQTIEWEYESNRYLFANGIQLTDDSDNPQVQYGGGIRVRSIKSKDGTSAKDKTISYFYTQTAEAGNFEENGINSCGHATALPYPYLLDASADKRPLPARGGLYTAAKIAYEQCIVADGYDWKNHRAPNGYTVYKFVTSKDFPNLGEYGMTDYSWKRGMVDTVEVYNSRNKLLSRDVSEYEYHEREISLPLLPLNSYYTQTHFENTSGWVKLKKTEKTVNGVKSSSTTLYANDLTVETADKDNSPPKKVSVFDANKKIMPYRYTPFLMDENDRVVVCKKTHSSEPTKEKIAIIKSDGTENIILCLGEYVNKDLATQSSNELWSEWQLYRELIDIGRCDVVGAEFLKMDANDDDDLVVVTNHRYQSSDIYLFVYVFHDIHINDITKQMEYHNNFGTVGRASFTRLDRKYDEVYKCPVGCVIGNFHGGAHPDFLILTHQYNSQPVYPGDLVPGQDRSIYAIMDFEERNPLDCIYTPTVYRSAVSYPYFGHSGFFTSLDNNGLKNDLVITGPGITTNAWLPKQTRPIVYHKFMNVDFDDVTHSIIISGGCQNCAADYELFTLNPIRGWDKFTFAGVFNDEVSDRLQFIFPEWSEDKFHFYTFNYHTSTFDADYDGVANRTYTKNSNGTILLSTNIPAFAQEPYSEMGASENKHMLTQQCGAVTYNLSGTTTEDVLKGDLSGYSNRVVSATALTWTTNNDGAWLPCANYAWKSPMDSAGLPITSYIPFNYTTPAANDTSWKLSDSICKYTIYASANLPKEIAKPTSKGGRLKSSIIYGHKGSITTGTVVNATFEECGVFTGDYDRDESNYFDKENSWEKGIGCDQNNPKPNPSVELSTESMFGTKSVRVNNSWGPTRNSRLSKGKNYIMTAWVKVESGKAWMAADYRYKTKISDNDWPVTGLTRDESAGLHGKELGPTNGKWELMKLEIPAATVLKSKDWETNNWYARSYVGSVIGGTVYVQDVRIAPKDAMVTSTYYDQKWYLPISSIDANNNPGNKVVYDEFGRVREVYKIKKDDFEHPVLLQSKEYYLQGEFLAQNYICLHYPNGTERFTAGQRVTVAWEMLEYGDVKLSYKKEGDATYTDIITQPYAAGYHNFNWIIPGELGGDYKFKVTIYRRNWTIFSDESDMPFKINALDVHSPVSTSEWAAGVRYQIKWVFAGPGTVDIFYDNGTTQVPIEDDVSNADGHGTYEWDVPLHYKTQPNSKIVIVNHANNSQKIESQNFLLVGNSKFIPKWLIGLFGKL